MDCVLGGRRCDRAWCSLQAVMQAGALTRRRRRQAGRRMEGWRDGVGREVDGEMRLWINEGASLTDGTTLGQGCFNFSLPLYMLSALFIMQKQANSKLLSQCCSLLFSLESFTREAQRNSSSNLWTFPSHSFSLKSPFDLTCGCTFINKPCLS